MLLMAVDTATRGCSVAILKDASLLGEVMTQKGETHSRHLMNHILLALQLSGCTLEMVDGFAVNHGPGSFTGLRIGISTVLGLAEASEKPVFGVSGLDALAQQAAAEPVCAMIDALRNEVYACCYRLGEAGAEPLSRPVTATPAAVMEMAPEGCRFIGNGAVRYRERIIEHFGEHAVRPMEACNDIRASTIARLARRQVNSGIAGDLLALRPAYLRKSDAELNAVQSFRNSLTDN